MNKNVIRFNEFTPGCAFLRFPASAHHVLQSHLLHEHFLHLQKHSGHYFTGKQSFFYDVMSISMITAPIFFGSRHLYLVLKIFGNTPSWFNWDKDQ